MIAQLATGTKTYTYDFTCKDCGAKWTATKTAPVARGRIIHTGCPARKTLPRGMQLRGLTVKAVRRYTHDENVTCDAACTTARGMDCKCSCGGEQHGSQASALPF